MTLQYSEPHALQSVGAREVQTVVLSFTHRPHIGTHAVGPAKPSQTITICVSITVTLGGALRKLDKLVCDFALSNLCWQAI
jgi:hypothetical protein